MIQWKAKVWDRPGWDNTMVDHPKAIVDIPNTMVDLPNTMVDNPYR